MCGIAGYLDCAGRRRTDAEVVRRMTDALAHRGPDASGTFLDHTAALGARRLRIIGLTDGDQPLFSEDGSVVLVCNGEIFNYRPLKKRLTAQGHRFASHTDVEVLIHLYEEIGVDLLHEIQGQFAFALYDAKRERLLLARDPVGVIPLYHALIDDVFVFGSEIKAILNHPLVRGEVDLTGLDQILSLPGLVSPRTMFRGIRSVEAGHYLTVSDDGVVDRTYWDLDYPMDDPAEPSETEGWYVERLRTVLTEAVRSRLRADVPVGFYLSGGLDSSLIAALINECAPENDWHTYSVDFVDADRSESTYQDVVAKRLGCTHHRIVFGVQDVIERLAEMIYHAECPVKETYNTCSLALSAAARADGRKVVLSGEGADELFAGYAGYQIDGTGFRGNGNDGSLGNVLEQDLRQRLWGDRQFVYERDQVAFRDVKKALYSDRLLEAFDAFECLQFDLVDATKLRGRHRLHVRSYLDFKLRMADHLLSDHGDRMGMVNAVEIRYPFLDAGVIDLARKLPPRLKLNGRTSKYILRKVAEPLLPAEITRREKFGWHAPGTPELLQSGDSWINDLLSHDRISRQGYFDADVVERIKKRYAQPEFALTYPFEDDLLMPVLTFGLFLDLYNLPCRI